MPTGELDLAQWNTTGDRGLMMPTRRRTRNQDRAYRIVLERSHNQTRITAEHQARLAAEAHAAACNDPPPF